MTIKRYWSANPPSCIKRDKEWQKFDAKLTPDDILEMQKIDADCNDCKFFQRGAMSKIGGLTKFVGQCLKFDKPTTAWPMQYTGHECFEHRRA